MWKAVLAVAVLSSLAFGEPTNGASHSGNNPVQGTQTNSQAQPADNTASLFLKLNSCLAQRPGTGGSLDEILKKAVSR